MIGKKSKFANCNVRFDQVPTTLHETQCEFNAIIQLMSDNTMLANQMYDQTFKIDVYHSVLYVVSSDDQA